MVITKITATTTVSINISTITIIITVVLVSPLPSHHLALGTRNFTNHLKYKSVIKSLSSGIRNLWFRIVTLSRTIVLYWLSYLTSMYLGFLICVTGSNLE